MRGPLVVPARVDARRADDRLTTPRRRETCLTLGQIRLIAAAPDDRKPRLSGAFVSRGAEIRTRDLQSPRLAR